MTMKKLARPFLLCAALALAGLPAGAQSSGPSRSALKGHDNRAPIDINAQRIEVRDLERQAIFTGDVLVTQAEMQLNAARMRVFYERIGSDLEIRRLDADGGVRLSSPSEKATARYGVYDVNNRTLTFLGDVVLNQGESVLRGQRLVIDLDSGRSTLDGRASSDGRDAGGRVTGRFVLPKRQ